MLLLATLLLPIGQATPTAEDVQALNGDWIYYECLSKDLPEGQQRPNHGPRFKVHVEKDVVAIESSRPGGPLIERHRLDGMPSTREERGIITTHAAAWTEGALHLKVKVDAPGKGEQREVSQMEFWLQPSPDGLLVRMRFASPIQLESTCLYKHPQDVPPPTPAPARIGDLEWLAGNWAGTLGTSVIEERWSPPAGGAMLATARTVRGERTSAFEFLRVIERDGSLVYVAQPGGNPPTEFVLTEIGPHFATFENPLHDFPQRIHYAMDDAGALRATIGYARGGRTQAFDFRRAE